MPNVLVRNVENEILERLKARASCYHHSLQQELKIILQRAAFQYTLREAAKMTEAFRKKMRRKQTNSAALIREDRQR